MLNHSFLKILTPDNTQQMSQVLWLEDPQILFVLNGNVHILCEGKKSVLKTNDVMVINRFSLYEISIEEGLTLNFFLKPQMTDRLSLPTPHLGFNCNSSEDTNKSLYHPLITVLAELAKILLSDSSNPYLELLFQSKVNRVFFELYTNFSENRPEKNSQQPGALKHFREILEDLRKNYNQAIPLKELAARHYMTPSYISHLFRKLVNKSYTQYVVLLRLEHARELLMSSSMTLDEIAGRSGFANARSMSGYFKKVYGMLPSSFRRQQKQFPEVSREDLALSPDYSPRQLARFLLSRYTGDSETAISQYHRPPIRIQIPLVSYAQSENIPGLCRHYLFYIPSYFHLLYQNIQDIGWQLTFFGEQTGVLLDQIIGHHSSCVFALENHRLSHVRFSLLDQALHYLEKNKLTPVLNLRVEPEGPDVFFHILRLLLKHLKSGYLREVHKFGICLDTFHMTVDSFSAIYTITRNMVKKVFPNLKIYIIINIQTFLENTPGFFHLPAPDGAIMVFPHYHMDEALLDELFSKLSDGPWKTTRIILSDLDLTPDRSKTADQNPSNDSFIRTSYLLDKWMKYGDKATGLACFLLTDFNDQYGENDPLFRGENGMLMPVSCRKNSFYFFDFLSHFEPRVLARGRSFLMRKDKENIEIFLFNPSFNDICQGENTDYGAIVYTTDLLNQYPKSIFEITLTDLPCEKYIGHFFQVSWKENCTYQYWLESNQLGIYSEPELESFKQKSMASFKRQLLLCDQRQLTFSVTLEVCALMRIMIEPIYE